jgi:hypothetical protein
MGINTTTPKICIATPTICIATLKICVATSICITTPKSV